MPEKYKSKEFPLEEVKLIVWDDLGCTLFERVSVGAWTAEVKSQSQEIVMVEVATGALYSYMNTREGSHWSGYTYAYEYESDPVRLFEVAPEKVTTTVWKRVPVVAPEEDSI